MSKSAIVITAVVALVSSVAWAQGARGVVDHDTFESGGTSGEWAPARVGATGRKTCLDIHGVIIPCAGTHQDGDLQAGVLWPEPRFVDNTDGTVTDMLTGLVWLKDMSCADLADTDVDGKAEWAAALPAAASLADGTCGLSDGSVVGDWRLPTRFELVSLLDLEYQGPALPNAMGTAQATEGDVFSGMQSDSYWSSTSDAGTTDSAWAVGFSTGVTFSYPKTDIKAVWPVRNGL
ncbi:MAG: hypothetical protein DRJ61_14815 [Acidobacteria bacterium]|nr:MAG: hypothetical protein DRJ61_14815 [Acidobacteriota bacterium]